MALIHHIEKLRAKPDHVRERIALGTSVGITGLVALIWVTTLAATGTFSLTPNTGTLADQADQNTSADQTANADQTATVQNSESASNPDGFSQLVGAAGAALGATSSDPEIHIVDDGTKPAATPAPVANNSDSTVIPF